MTASSTSSTISPATGRPPAPVAATLSRTGVKEETMLTEEENELLTRVGPGTPCGELLRRYWMPCALVIDLTAEQPTKLVRLLGEDLVIFRDKSGRLGML